MSLLKLFFKNKKTKYVFLFNNESKYGHFLTFLEMKIHINSIDYINTMKLLNSMDTQKHRRQDKLSMKKASL